MYLGDEGDEALIPVNLELVNLLWLPNIFVYNLKTFKVVTIYFTFITFHNIASQGGQCAPETRGAVDHPAQGRDVLPGNTN